MQQPRRLSSLGSSHWFVSTLNAARRRYLWFFFDILVSFDRQKWGKKQKWPDPAGLFVLFSYPVNQHNVALLKHCNIYLVGSTYAFLSEKKHKQRQIYKWKKVLHRESQKLFVSWLSWQTSARVKCAQRTENDHLRGI